MAALRTTAHVVIIAMLVCGATALRVNLEPGLKKCVGEDLNQDVLAVLEYEVVGTVAGSATAFEIKISSPAAVVWRKEDATKGKFAFTAKEDGLHQVCFSNLGQQLRSLKFSLKHGVDAKDYSEVAKKDHLQPLETELRRLEDAVAEVIEEMDYMQEREEAMRNTNESTNSRVMWYSVFTIVVLLGLGAAQIFILRRDFKAKKLIY